MLIWKPYWNVLNLEAILECGQNVKKIHEKFEKELKPIFILIKFFTKSNHVAAKIL